MGLSAGSKRTTILRAPLDAAGLRGWGGELPHAEFKPDTTPQPIRRVLVGWDQTPQGATQPGNGVSGAAIGPLVDRCSLWCSRISRGSGAWTPDSLPPVITLRAVKSVACIGADLRTFTWTPPAWDTADGWLYQIDDELTEAFELFACVDAQAPGIVEVDMFMLLDRRGGPRGVSVGANVVLVP